MGVVDRRTVRSSSLVDAAVMIHGYGSLLRSFLEDDQGGRKTRKPKPGRRSLNGFQTEFDFENGKSPATFSLGLIPYGANWASSRFRNLVARLFRTHGRLAECVASCYSRFADCCLPSMKTPTSETFAEVVLRTAVHTRLPTVRNNSSKRASLIYRQPVSLLRLVPAWRLTNAVGCGSGTLKVRLILSYRN